jgi:hypothetical protein
MDSSASSQLLLNNFHGRILSSLQPTTCLIYGIKNIYFLNDDLTQIPFHIRGRGGGGGSMGMGGLEPIDVARSEQVELIAGGGGEEVCAVCLEPILNNSPNCLTTCCNHTFHISCLIPLESSQCPVCRFLLPSPNLSHTVDSNMTPQLHSLLALFVLFSHQSLTVKTRLTPGSVLSVVLLVVVLVV